MLELKEGAAIHFIGVGGIGMSALAEVFLAYGYKVSGSDSCRNANIERLEEAGLKFNATHVKENVRGVDLVIYSSAIKEANPERIAATESKTPLLHRGKVLANLHNQKFGFSISGSHGKTTTTSITLSLMSHLDLMPTGVVGGIVKEFGSNALIGSSDYFIAEADESDGSFLHFKPQVAVVTNIDSDHLDHYQTLEKIKDSFKSFVDQIASDGVFIFNKSDRNSEELKSSRSKAISFGLDSSADYYAQNIVNTEAGSEFELCYRGEIFKAQISLSGEHNVLNSIAAIAAVHQVYPDLGAICETLRKFGGAGRRFDLIYESSSLVVVDDYAHHPTELRATINSFRERYKDRELKIIFEPHRFSRTKDFWNEFIDVLSLKEAVYISNIYSAGEDAIDGINTQKLIAEINENSGNAQFLINWESLKDHFNESYNKNSAVLVLGAGPISTHARNQVSEWISKI